MEEIEGFEVFTGYRRKTRGPMVTIKKGGEFSLNYKAFEVLGEPETVKLLYNRTKRLIGFRAGGDTPVRQQGKSRCYQIAGRAFVNHYSIDASEARKYEATLQEDMLIIDLTVID